jgi:hypothetical protein
MRVVTYPSPRHRIQVKIWLLLQAQEPPHRSCPLVMTTSTFHPLPNCLAALQKKQSYRIYTVSDLLTNKLLNGNETPKPKTSDPELSGVPSIVDNPSQGYSHFASRTTLLSTLNLTAVSGICSQAGGCSAERTAPGWFHPPCVPERSYF